MASHSGLRVFFLLSALVLFSLCSDVSRISHLLSFLNSHIAADPGSAQPRLHAAYYGAEILNLLSKHPGYIQSGVISTSDFTFKLSTYVSQLQLKVESEDGYGGFQAFPNEKKDYELFEDQLVSSVVNSYLVGRVLEIGSSSLGGDDYFSRVNGEAALKFLVKSRADGVYLQNPRGTASTASVLYGSLAWGVWSKAKPNSGLSGVDKASISKFLGNLYSSGGFRPNSVTPTPDLRSTFEAVKTLNLLSLWDSINGEKGKDIRPDIAQFVAKHRIEGSGYSEAPGQEPDVISTSIAISILTTIGSKNLAVDELAAFVVSLQAPDGGWKLRKANSGSGHYVNTFYALEALEALGKTSLLESNFRKEGVFVYHHPQYLPTIAVYVVIILAIASFSLFLFLSPGSKSEEENVNAQDAVQDSAETEVDGKTTKSKSGAKKKKKEATITLIRNNETKECVDEDGVAFSVETLDRTAWDIVSQENKGKHTVYVIRKKDSQLTSPLRSRKRK